jgi:hypothetical protein
MANIPGISGYVQPGVFARDRVSSRGVSLSGGLRLACIMGEGLREEIVVSPATGGGQDGLASVSPTGSGDGRFFKLAGAPVISGRTELYLNNSLLFGAQDSVIDTAGFDQGFDYRINIETGVIELQGASIGDQDGRRYSASTLNVGTGFLPSGTCGTLGDIISIADENAPAERWTIKCVSVIRDDNGDPIPGRSTFTAVGSVSGQINDDSGRPITFSSSYYTSSAGAVSGNKVTSDHGLVVAAGADWGAGVATLRAGDQTVGTTDTFIINGNLIAQGQVLPGDELCVDGYVGHEIDSLAFDGSATTITLTSDSLELSLEADEGGSWTTAGWDIRASNVLIDDESVVHDVVTGTPNTEGSFSSASVGKVVALCGAGNVDSGLFKVSAVTSSRRLRVHKLGDKTAGFSEMEDGLVNEGIGQNGLEFHMLETNGVLLFGIKEIAAAGEEVITPFEVGDKFFIDINSRILKAGDELIAKYISELDINDPEFFASAIQLQAKHGGPSVDNTLSLGAQLAFENGAPGVLAMQCKPPVPRRTSVTLIEEVDSNGDGGFAGCTGGADNCEVDDLKLVIPRPITGLRSGRPSGGTSVNIFSVRNGVENQIFPNKTGFYNTQLESEVTQLDFISSSDFSFGYTVINTGFDVIGSGSNGSLATESELTTFSTLELDFDAEHIGYEIVVTSMEQQDGNILTSASDISNALFGEGKDPVLTISGIVSDAEVSVLGTISLAGFSDIQFFVRNPADTTNVDAALLLHSDLVRSGVIAQGDGIRISYIDENDADFFDTNWFSALEILEAHNTQILVPLPNQSISSIFRAAVSHCENMSTIANQKERMALIGAQKGVTPAALIGQEEIAIEDIGIIEGIQGDDPEEVLSGNIEDLVNFKLNDNYTSNRAVFFWPDEIVRSVNGTNTKIHGFYTAAAAAGWLSATQNIAIPLTHKTLSGFSILRDKMLRAVVKNSLGSVGATMLVPVTGGGKVLAGRTTSTSGFVEDEEISVMFIRDRVKQNLRDAMRSFIGRVQDENTVPLMGLRAQSVMSGMISQGLVSSYKDITVERDKIDPRQMNVFLRFIPAYPINYVYIDIEVGIQ